jgi:asparagine synthase (glutamine-hydrolysing)
VAFAWNSIDPEQSLIAEQLTKRLADDDGKWQSVFDTPGFTVFDMRPRNSAYHAYMLSGNSGALVGKLFSRCDGEHGDLSDPVFGDSETASIIQTRGRFLTERYWGHYVLFLRGPDGNTVSVLRDPTGGLPCFLARKAGLHIFLSNVDDSLPLKLGPFSVDWQHIIAFFVHSRLISHSTGLANVSQLAAGQCVVIDLRRREKGNVIEFHWHPARIYEAGAIEDPIQAKNRLREAVQYCVSAWASCYQSIVHELSGGLDSSVVAANLDRSPAELMVTCFNYFTDLTTGDERLYARAVAEKYKLELVECPVTVAQRSLTLQLSEACVATPAVLGFLPESEDAKRELLQNRNAGAVFSGQGGDHLFQHGKNVLVAAEFLFRYGVCVPLLRVIAETSRLSDESIWFILRTALRYGLLRRRFDPYAIFQPPSILAASARHALSIDAYVHPWVLIAQTLPASKVKLIFDLIDCQLFYLRPYPCADQIHPLISQPIIECCIQIPSHIMSFRGVSRGLIREAFRDRLPARIVDRKTKGATTNYFSRLLIENIATVRELLIPGRLAAEGLLDRKVLERELSEGNLIRGAELRSILNAVRAEAWLRAWRM